MGVSGKPKTGVEAASRESGSSPEYDEEDVPVKGKRARRHRITRNACKQCRAKKTKCDGQHPICSRCLGGGLGCTYDVDQGVTKMQSLKDQLDRKTKDHENKAALLRVLVEGSDQQATELLARLRMAHTASVSPAAITFRSSPASPNMIRSLSHPDLHPLWQNETIMPPSIDSESNIYAFSPENAAWRQQQQASDEAERTGTPSSAGSLPLKHQDGNAHMGYPAQSQYETRRTSIPFMQYESYAGGPPRPPAVPAYSMTTTNGWPDPSQQTYFAH